MKAAYMLCLLLDLLLLYSMDFSSEFNVTIVSFKFYNFISHINISEGNFPLIIINCVCV